jgi:hypothetical protein
MPEIIYTEVFVLVRWQIVEPPWGIEPQTYALRVDLQVSA